LPAKQLPKDPGTAYTILRHQAPSGAHSRMSRLDPMSISSQLPDENNPNGNALQ
jgi:hypothetical protein